MVTNIISNGASSFRIKRPLMTTNGLISEVDTTVKGHLEELNTLLSKRIFLRDILDGNIGDDLAVAISQGFGQLSHDVEDLTATVTDEQGSSQTLPSQGRGGRGKRTNASSGIGEEFGVPPDEALGQGMNGGAGASGMGKNPSPIKTLLSLPLAPKQVPENRWADGSLLQIIRHTPDSPDKVSLSDYVETTPELSALKYAFESNLAFNRFNLDFNTKTVVEDYPAIRDYLIAWSYAVMGARDINGVNNFIFSNRSGAKNVADYAIVSAARTLIERNKLRVHDANLDNSPIVTKIKDAALLMTVTSFETTALDVIRNFILNARESHLIDTAGIGPIPANIRPQLIQAIRNSPIPITAENVKAFMPLFVSQVLGTGSSTADVPQTDFEQTQADSDFEVEFFTDDKTQVQISISAVKCAAQMFYSMVLDTDFHVFDTVNFLTHNELVNKKVEIRDGRLRDDLQHYVFSNRFPRLKSNLSKTETLEDRTRPAERQMFYRQVFGYGNAKVSDNAAVNSEFPRLWKVLILESAKYLQRAQTSFNPDSYVSRQNVMQAIEDLQYNLSIYCTGMANVITPLIHEELKFVVKRILMHPRVIQIVPTTTTWWQVVESIQQEMGHPRPKGTVIYNKAKLGYDIIRAIADYTPQAFEDDGTFSQFISTVDAFITTQSILQDALTDDLKKDQEDNSGRNGASQNGMYPPAAMPMPSAGAPASERHDEWDF